MALTDESNGNGFYMPVAPAYGGQGGFGNGFGGDWGWIILLLLLAGNGGWGMGGFGGMWPMMMGGMAGGCELYPWLNNSQNINGGFRDQMLNTTINGIQNAVTTGFGDVQNSLCSGFAGVNASISGAQSSIAQQLYANQISDLERSFAAQTATTQGMTALQSQLAQCCCDNRAGLADLKYTVATENCADRAAVSDALRDVIAANTASTQRILDQLCADKIEQKNDQIAQLRQELSMRDLAASQTAQTATLRAGQVAEVDALYNRLAACPVPTYNVPNPNCCYNSCGCGCNS